MRSRLFVMTLLIASIALLHTIFYIAMLTPFSTDVWPLIRTSWRLLEYPNAKIWNDTLFDGYNNHWPGIAIGATVVDLVTGLGLDLTYGAYLVMVLNIAIALLIYAICKGRGLALPSLVMLLAMPSFFVFTSAALKETYSYPIALSILFLVLRGCGFRRLITVLPILSLAQVLTHHLSTLMTMLMAISTTILITMDNLRGVDAPMDLVKRFLTYLVISIPISTLYYLLYGCHGLRIRLSLSDAYTLSLYFVLSYALYLMLRRGKRWGVRIRILLVASSMAMLFAVIRLGLVMGMSVTFRSVYPYALATLLPMLAMERECDLSYVRRSIFLNVLTLWGYVVFSKPVLVNTMHRLANYLALGYALSSYEVSNRYSVPMCIAIAISVALTIFVTSSILLGYDDICFYWLYSREDTFVVKYLRNHLLGNVNVVGDDRLGYLASMIMRVDTAKLLRIVFTKNPSPEMLGKNVVLVVNSIDLRKGFAISLSIYRAHWSGQVVDRAFSRILSSTNYLVLWC